jgi:hypothetical protein
MLNMTFLNQLIWELLLVFSQKALYVLVSFKQAEHGSLDFFAPKSVDYSSSSDSLTTVGCLRAHLYSFNMQNRAASNVFVAP